LSNTNPAYAAKETFVTVRRSGFAEVLRGISFTPIGDDDHRSW
jgi:hypothetical protein